jgi:hypothetical protein
MTSEEHSSDGKIGQKGSLTILDVDLKSRNFHTLCNVSHLYDGGGLCSISLLYPLRLWNQSSQSQTTDSSHAKPF